MYDKITAGETVKFTAKITDLKNHLEDPVGLTFTVKDPANAVRSYVYGTDAELVKDSLAKFSINIILTLAGTYKVRWETAAPNVSIEEETVIAEAKSF